MSTQLARFINPRYLFGMTDLPEPKDKRIALVMTASELQAVDDWSFARRIRSRGEAIRQLISRGIKASEKDGK